MKITTIIFDLGGVVLHHAKVITPGLLAKTYEISEELAQGTYKTRGADWRIGKMSSRQFFTIFKEAYGTPKAVGELLKAYQKAYLEIAVIDRQILTLIDALRKKYTVAAFTNTNELHQKINEERGLFDHFDRVFTSNRIGYAKPDPRAYEFVTAELTIQPGEALFIDDKEENIKPAEQLGMAVYLYTDHEQLRRELITLQLL